MLEEVKRRCGIAPGVKAYDSDIQLYIEDAEQDLVASGVPPDLVKDRTPAVVTAVSLYVKALIGNDRTDTEKYMDLYRKKVFRLTLEG